MEGWGGGRGWGGGGVGWLAACLKCQQFASVSQGRILLIIIVCCSLNVPANMLVYLRDGSC